MFWIYPVQSIFIKKNYKHLVIRFAITELFLLLFQGFGCNRENQGKKFYFKNWCRIQALIIINAYDKIEKYPPL